MQSGRSPRVLRSPAGGEAQITLYDEAVWWICNYSATCQEQQQAIWPECAGLIRKLEVGRASAAVLGRMREICR